MEGPDTSTTRAAKVNSSTVAVTAHTSTCTHSYSPRRESASLLSRFPPRT